MNMRLTLSKDEVAEIICKHVEGMFVGMVAEVTSGSYCYEDTRVELTPKSEAKPVETE